MANPEIAAHAQGFFKTAKGEYGAGDRFHGVRVPALRSIARRFQSADLGAIQNLLRSAFHEERLLAAIMLRTRFEKGDEIRSRTPASNHQETPVHT